jgi:hypothetical protein
VARDDATGRDPGEATRRFLEGLAAGAGVDELGMKLADLNLKHDTFLGEVFLGLAARSLAGVSGAGAGPIAYEGLRERHLPEVTLRGKENRKFQFAALCAGAIAGGLEPDLVDEVYWWRTDDLWRYAFFAAVAVIRAGAEARGMTVDQIVAELSGSSD